ncbi:MAG: tetratricopeptide repeat protein [Pseudomonadota bacterium]
MKQTAKAAKNAVSMPAGSRRVALAALAAAIVVALIWQVTKPETDIATDLRNGDYAIAFDRLREKAAAGDPWSQNQLGNLYYLGLGTPVDLKQAGEWYLRSALGDWADAQINVSLMYRYGRGLPHEPARGFAWLRHARSNGKEIAETYLSWIAGSLEQTPSQMQAAKRKYATLESLRPEGFK